LYYAGDDMVSVLKTKTPCFIINYQDPLSMGSQGRLDLNNTTP